MRVPAEGAELAGSSPAFDGVSGSHVTDGAEESWLIFKRRGIQFAPRKGLTCRTSRSWFLPVTEASEEAPRSKLGTR